MSYYSSDEECLVSEFEDAIDEALSVGMEVVRSDSTHLLLDLDNDASVESYLQAMAGVSPSFELVEVERWTSKSGIGLHVVLSCAEMDFPTRCALQACLGSDKVRELFAIARFRAGIEEPSMLFKPATPGAELVAALAMDPEKFAQRMDEGAR